jgi:7-cyano-7-deazaguanine reductase
MSAAQIDQESLLRYLIGFRNHNEFHEQCVERILLISCATANRRVISLCTLYPPWRLDINPGAVISRPEKTCK